MGFMGAYVWSAQNIFRRLVTIDLLPRAYYNVGIRMILAAFAALALHHFFAALPSEEYTADMLPVLAFLTGMFPERAIHYLQGRLRIFSPKASNKADELPLEMIEGINVLHKIRLAEVGIDNVQNLAESNIIELLIKTPYRARQVIDWTAQAKLCLYFKSDIIKLRKIGIRTIFDIKTIGNVEKNLCEIAQSTEISELSLKLVYERIRDDISVERLMKAENLLSII